MVQCILRFFSSYYDIDTETSQPFINRYLKILQAVYTILSTEQLSI